MQVDRAFVIQEQFLVRPVRDGHDVYVAKLRSGLAPVTMGQNVMTANFAAGFYFAARAGPPNEIAR